MSRSGFLVLDKEEGITSHDLISRARRVLGTRRIGHAGTLDPMATGVMVLGVESATRLLDYVTAGRKRYLATVKLGERTHTDDRMGEVIENLALDLPLAKSTLQAMVGVIDQIPSSVSAIKVDGRRAYDRVRSGEEVELRSRKVEIFAIEIIGERGDSLDIDVTCSPGTYIRAIARDIGGHLTALRRIESQPFTIEDCGDISLDAVIPSASVMRRVMATYQATEDERRELALGRSISFLPDSLSINTGVRDDIVAVLSLTASTGISNSHEVIALAKRRDDRLQPSVVLPECSKSAK